MKPKDMCIGRFCLYSSVKILTDRSKNPLDLLTDISLNCDDEVLSVCETIREELCNPQDEANKMDISELFKPFNIDQHIKETMEKLDKTKVNKNE